MSAIDSLGCLAGALVLIAFYMRDPRRMRQAAIASNIAFIAYGLGADLMPVVLLHAVLLPLNIDRLSEIAGTGQDPMRIWLRGGARKR